MISNLKISVPQLGIEPWSLAIRASIITTRPPRTPDNMRKIMEFWCLGMSWDLLFYE